MRLTDLFDTNQLLINWYRNLNKTSRTLFTGIQGTIKSFIMASAFDNNPDKIIFIAWGLIEDFKCLNKKTGLFLNFSQLDKNKMVITDLNIVNNIFIHRHFSDAISNTTLEKMKSQFDIYLNKTI